MNWRAISAIIRKDVGVAMRSKAVAMPLIILPLLLMVGVPVMMGSVVAFAERMQVNAPICRNCTTSSRPRFTRRPWPISRQPGQAWSFSLVYLFAPMYLILPLMVSVRRGGGQFCRGEGAAHAGGAGLHAHDRSGAAPGQDAGRLDPGRRGGHRRLSWSTRWWPIWWRSQVVGRLILPNLFWLLLAFWVGPAAAGLGLGVTVLVSSRVNTFQEAYQLGSLIVLPVVLLMIGQISGAFYLSDWLVFVIGLVLWLLNGVIFWVGAKSFKRSELIARL